MFKWVITIVLVCQALWASSQNSILNIPELNEAKEDSVKCRILDRLIEEESDANVWMVYNDEMMRITESKLKTLEGKDRFVYLKYLANALNNKGFDAQDKGSVDSTLTLFWKSLAIRYDIKDKEGIANSLNNIGHVYFKQADFKKASEYYLKGIKVQEEITDWEGLATSYNNLGSLYDRTKRTDEAIELFNKSLKIREEHKDLPGQAYCYNNLAKVYSDKQDLNKSLEYQLKALNIREGLNSKNQMGTSYNNIGIIYLRLGDFEKAKFYLEKALRLHIEIEDRQGESVSLKNLGLMYQEQKNNKKATECFTKSLKLAMDLGYPDDILWPSKSLYHIYKAKGDHKASLEMLELFQRMKDSVYKSSVINKIPDITIKDPTELSNNNNVCEDLEKERAEMSAQLSDKNNYILLLVVSLLLAFAYIIFNFFKRKP